MVGVINALTELRSALDELEHDDPRLTAMLELLRSSRPALRFELFGGFKVMRGGAQIALERFEVRDALERGVTLLEALYPAPCALVRDRDA